MKAEYAQAPVRLAAVIGRANAINLTISMLMTRAGFSRSRQAAIYRWAAAAVDPQLRHFERVMGTLETRLAIEEDMLRSALRLPEAAE